MLFKYCSSFHGDGFPIFLIWAASKSVQGVSRPHCKWQKVDAWINISNFWRTLVFKCDVANFQMPQDQRCHMIWLIGSKLAVFRDDGDDHEWQPWWNFHLIHRACRLKPPDAFVRTQGLFLWTPCSSNSMMRIWPNPK